MKRKVVASFGAMTVALMSLLVPSLERHEGVRTTAYLDPIGIPTVCVGETKGVKLGDMYTKAECEQMLEARLTEFDDELSRCIHGEFPLEVRAAVISWAYNVGSDAACKSTLVKKLNSGDLKAACAEIPKWKFAGGKVLPGIVKRRAEEAALCMKGT